MKVAVSACLLGENCKYNGGNNKNEKLLTFLRDKEVIPICPEVLGGLPVPRSPVELQGGRAVDADGISRDEEFRLGARRALEIILREKAELVILQSRSPSCGVRQIYDGSFSKMLVDGQGIFARMACAAGFKVMDAEEL